MGQDSSDCPWSVNWHLLFDGRLPESSQQRIIIGSKLHPFSM
jgi:hypothetical protein